MLVSEAIAAIAAIDRAGGDGVVLAPHADADALPPSAHALAELLRSSHVIAVAERYERLDAEASAAQVRFRRQLNLANVMVLLSALASACLMGTALLEGVLGPWTGYLLVAFGLIGIGVGAAAFVALNRLKEGSLLGHWMTTRARAETTRLEFFSSLVAQANTRADVASRQLALEYFRRRQLELQVEYYDRRGAEHRADADAALRWSGVAAGVASAGAAAAGLLGVLATEWAALGGVAIAGTALGSYATVREAANQDLRNAERYGRTLESLLALGERLDEVREAVAAGSRAALEEFVAAVQGRLSLEHRQWLKDSELAQSATSRLEAALADAQLRRG